MRGSDKERILVAAHGHPEISRGGGEVAAYSLFKALREDGAVEASFLAHCDHPAYQRIGTPFSSFRGREDETIFYGGEPFDYFLFSQKPSSLAHYADYLRATDPDVIHLHHYSKFGLEFIALARRLRPDVRIVMTLHEYLAVCHHHGQMLKTDSRTLCKSASPQDCSLCFPNIAPGEFLLRERFIKAHFAKVDMFIAPSRFLMRRYVEWGLPEDRIVQISNGTKRLTPPPPRALLKGETRGVFAFFGQITPYKGMLELLRAFELIAQAPAEVSAGLRLSVHSANLESQKPEFVDQVTKALIRTSGRVMFAGPFDHEDLPRLMEGVDWVVVPSLWWENSPMVIEEALANKRPVICSNIGGMAEKVTHGRDGLHFQAGNPFDLANTLVGAARSKDQWSQLRANMRHPLSIDDWKDEHLDVYQQIVPSRARSFLTE